MTDATGRSDGGLYQDWDLLLRIDRDLRDLAQRYGLPLDEIPDGLSPSEQTKADQLRTKQVRDIVQEMGRRGERDPVSWKELALGMSFAGGWLVWFVKSRRYCLALPGNDERESVLTDVLVPLYFAIIRNAGKWYRRGNHDGDWKGYVICQARGKANRFARARLKKIARERAEARGGDVEDLPDPRGLTPEQEAELREMINAWPDDEREVVSRLYFDRQSVEEVVEALKTTREQLESILKRAGQRLRSKLRGGG
jgi:RNA polymerase sigma factor (sigma-70 family)